MLFFRLVASQFTLGLSRELREIDDDMEIDEDEDAQEPSAKQQTSICLLECQMVRPFSDSVLMVFLKFVTYSNVYISRFMLY